MHFHIQKIDYSDKDYKPHRQVHVTDVIAGTGPDNNSVYYSGRKTPSLIKAA